jgi:hypothetical protein
VGIRRGHKKLPCAAFARSLDDYAVSDAFDPDREVSAAVLGTC